VCRSGANGELIIFRHFGPIFGEKMGDFL
jgi:hypothetical protein